MIYLLIYCTGLVVLIAAIVANMLASFFGLATWYDVLSSVDVSLNILDLVWLLVIYPSILGASAIGFRKLFLKIKNKIN